MLTKIELEQIKNQLNQSEINRATVLKLIAEVERLQSFVLDYNRSVTAQIQAIEDNMDLLEAENEKLLIGKNTAFIERDACIGLLAQIARKSGIEVGVAPQNRVVIDLPSGQVSWNFSEAESHMFTDLPEYSSEIEEMPIEEKYRRVMNSGVEVV